jgi:hypothetical protein
VIYGDIFVFRRLILKCFVRFTACRLPFSFFISRERGSHSLTPPTTPLPKAALKSNYLPKKRKFKSLHPNKRTTHGNNIRGTLYIQLKYKSTSALNLSTHLYRLSTSLRLSIFLISLYTSLNYELTKAPEPCPLLSPSNDISEERLDRRLRT